ncbi:MAG: hypothetical protein C0404_07420 [Verrucomicrobia bacterium]|nr:hypothetical protein [Verrucomicrobiota bacterium]
MKTVFWTFSLTPWVLVVGVLFLAGMAFLSFRLAWANRGHGTKLWLIEALRLAVASLFVFTLMKPEFVVQTERKEKPMVAVLCDVSGSMATKDVKGADGAEMTRAGWIETQKLARCWSPLEKKYGVVVVDFAASPAGTKTNEAMDDSGTDLNMALERVMQGYPNLRAVVMMSDGDWNMGQSPVSAATKLCVREIPLFAVGVGADRFIPDLELKSVSAPVYALIEERLSIPFTVQSRLPRQVKTTVRLQGLGGTEAEREVVIPAMGQCQQAIDFVPMRPGDFEYVLKVPPDKDEVFLNNNEKSFRISVRREKLKVLVVESQPRWEFRFLRNAFARDPGVEASSLLLHPGLNPGAGKGYIQKFPSREELSLYDVIFLGEVGVGKDELTLEQAEWLKGVVEKQGSGLVFLPGLKGRHTTFAGTPLGELMPVELDGKWTVPPAARLESHLALTQQGRDHLLTMLAPTPAENELLWKSLPGFWWYAPVVKAKPGTDVLAIHSDARNQHGRIPLLVTRNVGSGKVLFLGTDGAWRWRRGVEDTYHYRFWGQVVRWMSHQRHLTQQEGIRFFFNPETPQIGDRVFMHATVYDKNGYPVNAGTVRASITGDDGSVERIDLGLEAGDWGVFTGSFVPRRGGKHKVDVVCEEAERSMSLVLEIGSPKRELVGRPGRMDVLKEIAAIARGKYGTTQEIGDIVRGVQLLPEPRPIEDRMRLWCHPLWLLLLTGLLGVYWTARKFAGMV